MFGIDKSIIKNLELESIDFKKLIRKNNVIIQTEGITMPVMDYATGDILNIAYVKITDEYIFNTLKIGIKVNNLMTIQYAILELHINEADENEIGNLKPLNLQEYHCLLTKVKDYLANEYGVYINFLNAKFENLELNKTIRLNRNFQEYKHILELMCKLAPKTYKVRTIKMNNRNELETIIIANNSLECSVYNKTKQLLAVYKIEINDEYMRIEYTLETAKKIEQIFKNNSIFGLTDEQIKDYLQERIEKDLIKPLEKHIEKGNKKLIKIAKEEKKKDARKWTRHFVLRAMIDKDEEDIPLVVCNEQIKAVLKKETKTNYSRALKNVSNDLDSNKNLEENMFKLDEIISKIFN